MRLRFLFHVMLFVALAGIGAWIAYQGVVAPTRFGPLDIDVETAAMYWFALLIYGFTNLLLYYPLRRSWGALLIGHIVAAMIAVASTATVVTLGIRNSPTPPDAPSASAGEGSTAPAPAPPSGQPLPLPKPEESAEPHPGQ